MILIHGAIICAHAVYLLFHTITPTSGQANSGAEGHHAHTHSSCSRSLHPCGAACSDPVWLPSCFSFYFLLLPPRLVALNILLLIKYITWRITKGQCDRLANLANPCRVEAMRNQPSSQAANALTKSSPIAASHSQHPPASQGPFTFSRLDCRVSLCRTFNALLLLKIVHKFCV